MKSKYYQIYEVVPKELYESYLEDELWKMFTPQIIKTIDRIKEKFNKGSITINNYFWNGSYNWSGLRFNTDDCDVYNKNSQHTFDINKNKLCNAMDLKFSHYDVQDVQKYIITHRDEFPELTRLENTIGNDRSWLHVDCKLPNVVVFNG